LGFVVFDIPVVERRIKVKVKVRVKVKVKKMIKEIINAWTMLNDDKRIWSELDLEDKFTRIQNVITFYVGISMILTAWIASLSFIVAFIIIFMF